MWQSREPLSIQQDRCACSSQRQTVDKLVHLHHRAVFVTVLQQSLPHLLRLQQELVACKEIHSDCLHIAINIIISIISTIIIIIITTVVVMIIIIIIIIPSTFIIIIIVIVVIIITIIIIIILLLLLTPNLKNCRHLH